MPNLSEHGEDEQEAMEEPDLSIPGPTYMRLMAHTPLSVLPGEPNTAVAALVWWTDPPSNAARRVGRRRRVGTIINQSSSFYLMTQ